MALQITCLFCGEHFLLCSANTAITLVELDSQKKVEIGVTCPYCHRVNMVEYLAPIVGKLQSPTEAAKAGFVFALGAVVSEVRPRRSMCN